MAKKITNLLKKLFDYQRFEQNESLNNEIKNVCERSKDYLLEDNNLLAAVGGTGSKPEKHEPDEKHIK